jgi:hypothetical protein
MSVAREYPTATLLASGKVLVTGGINDSDYLSSAELYDPVTDHWSDAGTMSAARLKQTATLLANGKVLVAGGYNGSSYLSSAELYDPGTDLQAPVITTQPTNQTVTAGQTATFTAAASGSPPPTVQWQLSTDGGATFSDIAGATAPTLSFVPTLVAQTGNQYRAVFTNAAGTATSSAVTLTVTPAAADHLVFLQQPTDTAAGQTMGAVLVEVVDAFGNVETSDNSDTITLSIGTNPSGGTLSGTLTLTVVNGVATFTDLSIDLAGAGYTLHATTGGGLPDIDSNPFNVL